MKTAEALKLAIEELYRKQKRSLCDEQRWNQIGDAISTLESLKDVVESERPLTEVEED